MPKGQVSTKVTRPRSPRQPKLSFSKVTQVREPRLLVSDCSKAEKE